MDLPSLGNSYGYVFSTFDLCFFLYKDYFYRMATNDEVVERYYNKTMSQPIQSIWHDRVLTKANIAPQEFVPKPDLISFIISLPVTWFFNTSFSFYIFSFGVKTSCHFIIVLFLRALY